MSAAEGYTQEETESWNTLNFIMDEKTPCDVCAYRHRCANGSLACSAFAKYVQTGDAGIGITSGDKNPSALIFRRIFYRKERVIP